MTEPRDPDLQDPEDSQTETYPAQPYPAQPYPAQPNVPTEAPTNAGVSYGRPATYSPPVDSRSNWPAQPWQQQTPPHWLEPLPGQDRRQRQGMSARYLALVVIIALLAGVIG